MYPCGPPRGGPHVLTPPGGSAYPKSTHLQDSKTLSAHKMAFYSIRLLQKGFPSYDWTFTSFFI